MRSACCHSPVALRCRIRSGRIRPGRIFAFQRAPDMAAGLRIVDLLRHHAEQTPNRVALRIDGEPRSFLQLHQGVLQVAGRLQTIARPGDRVGLWFHNCFAWVECFLALDLLGAVSVPINTRLFAFNTLRAPHRCPRASC
ncbi:MAG: long-chain fatty acid--CoA ligase [Betaproteobacteria bacterium]|nr:long-chain fatty acid--CoA ligase [Betaproteobacteria bacterium]